MSDEMQAQINDLNRQLHEIKDGQKQGRWSNIWITSGSAAMILVAILSGLAYLISWQGQTSQRLADQDRRYDAQQDQIKSNSMAIGTLTSEIQRDENERAANQQAIIDAIGKLQSKP